MAAQPSLRRRDPTIRDILRPCSAWPRWKVSCAAGPSSNGKQPERDLNSFMHFLLLGCLGLILGLVPAAFDVNADSAPKNPAVNENFYGVQIIGDRIWLVG